MILTLNQDFSQEKQKIFNKYLNIYIEFDL